MATQVLPQANAFSQGAELWILPDAKSSSWTNEVDWYLNFQIAKFNARELKFSKIPFESLQNQWNFVSESPVFMSDTELLLSGENRLPTRYIMILPFDVELSVWAAQAIKKAEDLGVTNVRLFLPKNISETNSETTVQRHLNSLKKSTTIALVLNREAHI